MKYCGEVMTKNPVFCLADDTVEAAAAVMKEEQVGPVPIVQDEDSLKVIGIVTDRDLVLRVLAEKRDPKKTALRDVMTKKIISCKESDDLEEAMKAMSDHQIRRIPVVDEKNRLIGIIAQADIATRAEEPEKTAEMVEEISEPTSAK